MLGYLFADIICSEKRTVFRERSSGKTVSYEEQIMSNGTNIRAYNPSNLFAPARLVKARHVTEYSPAKTGCVKDLKDNKDNSRHLGRKYINNSRHLARKYARIFVRGHYLFREANSFPSAKLGENCELRGTDNVQGQISELIIHQIFSLPRDWSKRVT